MVTLRNTPTLLAGASFVLAAGLGLGALPTDALPAAAPAAQATVVPAATALSGSADSAVLEGLATRATVGGASLITGPYAFSTVLGGKPVRWNPCAPIRWTSNTARGPAGGLTVLKASVARVAAITGTRWQYVGPTSKVPSSGYLPRTAAATYPPVLIGWTDAAASDLLRGRPRSTLGMTRTSWFGVQRPDGSKVAATRASVIALDRTDRLPLRGGTSWTAVTLHELGHAMGLAHVSSSRQLMASVLPRTLGDLQTGDRAGLVKLGRRAGCVTVP